MKAAIYRTYGPPDVLRIEDVAAPVPADDEVLIKVRAASVNPLECGVLSGAARIAVGLRKPKVTRLGVDVSGQVESVGRNVRQFKPGDNVFGACIRDPQGSAIQVWVCQGALAEFACAPEAALFQRPVNVTFEQAASVPVAALTALQGLRDKGHIGAGQKVLINGAAGGVGTFAVQIAKSFGAEVTGVCSTRNVEMVRSIGADRVIDYTQEDFTQLKSRYDLIFDGVGNHSLSALGRTLTSKGVCVMVGDRSGRGWVGILSRLVTALGMNWFTSQKFVTFLARPNQQDLAILYDLMASGRVRPVIDRVYSLGAVADAIRYLAQGHASGKVVITVSHNSGI